MEALKKLEAKLQHLAERIKKLHAENADLKTENAMLAEENGQLTAECMKLKTLVKEKEKTQLIVDDLIKSIDSLVETQSL